MIKIKQIKVSIYKWWSNNLSFDEKIMKVIILSNTTEREAYRGMQWVSSIGVPVISW